MTSELRQLFIDGYLHLSSYGYTTCLYLGNPGVTCSNCEVRILCRQIADYYPATEYQYLLEHYPELYI